jgi:hypothetical protein
MDVRLTRQSHNRKGERRRWRSFLYFFARNPLKSLDSEK